MASRQEIAWITDEDCKLQDNAKLIFGDGADRESETVGDVYMYFDGTDMHIASASSSTTLKFDIDTVLNFGAQANTAGSGIPIDSTDTKGLAVYLDDNGANIASSVRGIQSRFLLTVDQSAGTIRALQGQLKVLNGVDTATGIYTAVQGYVEFAATHAVSSGATTSCFDASAEIGTALTVASGGEFFGIHVETTGAGTITNNGTCAAIGITKASGAADWPVGLLVASSTTGVSIGAATTGLLISGATTNAISISGVNTTAAINISGNNTGHALTVTGTWSTGITGGAIAVGDYSNAIAFGTISEHLLGQVINVSAAVDDDSNIIPMHVAFTNTADCGANSVAQVIYGRATLAYAITDCYAIRARTDITDATTPTLNMVTGVFSTLTTKACEIAATGMLASIIGTVDGTEDITTVGYGKVCGAYIFWNQTNAMTADTVGVHIGVNTGATLDSGYRINAAGTLGISFHSYNSSGTMTTGLSIEGAHTNAFAFPVAGTAPTESAATGMAGLTSEGYVVVTIGGVAKKMYYFA